jgi:hypothetical protein
MDHAVNNVCLGIDKDKLDASTLISVIDEDDHETLCAHPTMDRGTDRYISPRDLH